MKILKLAILSILIISNYSLAIDSEKFIKNYLDFQKNYLNEAISFEKNKSSPDTDEIEKFLFCQNNLPAFFSYLNDMDFESETDAELMLFLKPKKLNKDVKSFFKIMQSQGEDFEIFSVLMQIDEESEKAPEPFEKINTNHFSIIFAQSMIYANGCEKGLEEVMEDFSEGIEELREVFDEYDEFNKPLTEKEQGNYTEIVSLHDNGQKDQETVYKNFAKVQDLYWYDTGEKRVEVNFAYGVVDSVVFFHKNGQNQEAGRYKNNKKDGVWTFWDENGIKDSETTYSNGLKTKTSSFSGNEVTVTTFYENGDLKFRGKWINGKKEGKLLWLFENEIVSGIESYTDGILNGISSSNYPNGKSKQIVEYIDGKMNGKVRAYDVNGNLTVNRIYKNDVCISGNC